MANLDFNDYLQMVGIVSVLFLGFLPTIKPIKGVTKYSVIVVMFFLVGLIATVYSTLAKSISDKENYIGLVDGNDSTIKKANENISTSNQIMGLNNESISRLKNIQDKNIELQNQTLIIQESSALLNQKLKEELDIQKQTNQSARDILKTIVNRNDKDRIFFRNRLMFTVNVLRFKNRLLYAGLSISDTDYARQYSILEKELSADAKNLLAVNANPQTTRDSVLQLINAWQLKNIRLGQLSDKINKTLRVYLDKEKVSRTYIVLDSVYAYNVVRTFLEETYNLVSQEFTNPILYSKMELVQLFNHYANYLQVNLSQCYLTKADYVDMKKIKELDDEHDKFIAEALKFDEVTHNSIPIK